MSDRLAYYRRWKLGEDPHALAKEAGVTRERMRHILAKMDAEVPVVDQLAAAEARIAELERECEKRGALADVVSHVADAHLARIAELEAALREMRDDRVGYRHAVHLRRRIATLLAGETGQ